MRLEVRQGIEDADWRFLTQWRERVFPEEGRGKEWSPVSWHILAYAEGPNPIGHIGFDRFYIAVDDVDLPVVGVGGVVVRPEYQGQHVPDLMFDELHRQKVLGPQAEIYTLFCPQRLVSYYSKHGYCQFSGAVSFLQRGTRVQSDFEFMWRGGVAESQSVALKGAPW